MDDIVQIESVDVDASLDALADRYRRAGGFGIDLLNMIGGRAENLIDRLPQATRGSLEQATQAALTQAMSIAHESRSIVPDQKGWLNSAIGAAMGAVGGMGGLPTALAELPVTTTLLLRVIQGVSKEYGFDPAAENVKFDGVKVFASAGPLEADDGADLGFITVRVTLTGAAVNGLIARVSPRLATVLGQKLAAQTVPVLGAMAGAATNYAYTHYYQEIAHVHFGLRRLAVDSELPVDELVLRLRTRVQNRSVRP